MFSSSAGRITVDFLKVYNDACLRSDYLLDFERADYLLTAALATVPAY